MQQIVCCGNSHTVSERRRARAVQLSLRAAQLQTGVEPELFVPRTAVRIGSAEDALVVRPPAVIRFVEMRPLSNAAYKLMSLSNGSSRVSELLERDLAQGPP